MDNSKGKEGECVGVHVHCQSEGMSTWERCLNIISYKYSVRRLKGRGKKNPLNLIFSGYVAYEYLSSPPRHCPLCIRAVRGIFRTTCVKTWENKQINNISGRETHTQ